MADIHTFGQYRGMYLNAVLSLLKSKREFFVASKLQLWFNLTRLAILNCCQRIHYINCRQSNILGFPTTVGDIRIAYRIFIDLFIRGDFYFFSDKRRPFIIDGGSHIGLSILYFKLLYPEAKIVGFEPNPANFKLLKSNISIWGLRQVSIHNLALSDKRGKSKLVLISSVGDWSSHIRWGEEGEFITVNTTPLSAFLTKTVDYLKLDVEGEEEKVIRELSQSKKIHEILRLVIEFHHEPTLPFTYNSLANILSLLEKSSFSYYISCDPFLDHIGAYQFGCSIKDRFIPLIYASKSTSTLNG